MATQLTRRSFLSSFSSDEPVLRINPRILLALAAGCVVLVYASMLTATYTSRQNEAADERLYADTLTLIEAPAPDLAKLNTDLDAAKARLVEAEARVAPPAIDPSSDQATALLIRSAGASGLAVTGVARVDPSQLKYGETVYDVQAVRLTVQGTTARIQEFLYGLYDSDPALIATLTSLQVSAAGVAQAEIVFSAYTAVVAPTPVAGGAP
jgi:hypothetical protein